MARDTTGLSWKGSGRPPSAGGGFVGSVGLNEPVSQPLAVDPEAKVAPPASRHSAAAGPQLTVEAMRPPDDDRVRPGGRIRMPIG